MTPHNPSYDAIVVGAGAAGMMATLCAARRGLRILLIEKMEQPGLKLRITGKGRCNLTNTASLSDTLPHIGSDSRFLRNAYHSFFNRELMDFFEEQGTPLVVERGGRVFPSSGKAQDIFLTLIQAIERCPNVTIRKRSRVVRLHLPQGRLQGVVLQDGTVCRAPQVVLTTGGLSYPRTGATGDGYTLLRDTPHTVVPPLPALVSLVCREPIPTPLVDFTLRNVALTLSRTDGHVLCHHFGELSFCADGLDGPIALSASRQATRPLHNGETLVAHIDLKPAVDSTTLDHRLINDINLNGKRLLHDALRLWVPAPMVPLLLERLHLPQYQRLHQLNGDSRRKILSLLKDLSFTLTGTHSFEEAIITQGGVSLREINPKTMQSRLLPGLFIAGELLDLDADTGGYNLQIAFSTGHATGTALNTREQLSQPEV